VPTRPRLGPLMAWTKRLMGGCSGFAAYLRSGGTPCVARKLAGAIATSFSTESLLKDTSALLHDAPARADAALHPSREHWPRRR
jgi:hypothetical protein